MPGYVPPAAYGVARLDPEELTFGEGRPGGVHPPAAGRGAGVDLRLHVVDGAPPPSAEQLREAVTLLAPAEAALHWEHPNLWSWRELLDGGDESSTFLAFFVADPADPPVDDHDAAFRAELARPHSGGR